MKISEKDKNSLLDMLQETHSKYAATEINALLLVADGYPAEDIAKILNIKEHYVQIYKNRYTKYGIERILRNPNPEKISFNFNVLEHGWIEFFIYFNNVSIKIMISSIFDPFDDLIKWLLDIFHGNKSTLFRIDEEGKIKQFSFTYLPQYKSDLYELRITDGLSGIGAYDIKKIVYKKVFMEKFVIALNDLIEKTSDLIWYKDEIFSEKIKKGIQPINEAIQNNKL